MIARLRCYLLVGLIVLPVRAFALDASGWWKTPDQRGVELLQSGDAKAASEVFKQPGWRGISHYRDGNYADAQTEFSRADGLDSVYNEGTAAAHVGDYPTALEKFQEVIKADPDHEDAQHNLEITKQLIDLQQQQSEQSQDSESGQDKSEDESQGESQDESKQGESDSSDSDTSSQDGSQQAKSDQQGNSDKQSQNNDGQQKTDDSKSGRENDGELSTSAEDVKKQAQEQEQTQENEALSESTRSQSDTNEGDSGDTGRAQKEGEGAESEQAQAIDPTQLQPISESEQATEQWIRRIPDDPSQLLRNKIKLNHMIQHESVKDMPEPW